MPYKDISGQRFGRYTVLRYVGNDKHGCALWECKCDCGVVKTVLGSSLRRGLIVSCGCYHKEDLANRLTTHGMTHTRIREIWNCIKQRCLNPNNTAYQYYGGRGITICDEWKTDFSSFSKWAMENGYDDTLTIDRIDTNKGYDPSNCRWVSRKVQMNNRRCTPHYEMNGESHTIAEWCEIYNLSHKLVSKRVKKLGWSLDKALLTPPLEQYRH